MSLSIVPVAEADVVTLVKSIDKVVINPIIIFAFSVAIVYFLYGLAQYLLSPGNEEVRKKSKSHMIWGVLGLFIMVAVFGIEKIILNTFGENRVQINNNGDFTVSPNLDVSSNVKNGSTLTDKTILDNTKSNKDLFNGTLDISADNNAATLPPATFTTSPFPTYKQNSICWQKAITGGQATSEFDAMAHAKTAARSKYLVDFGLNAFDVGKTDKITGKDVYTYPVSFETKVLYDKTTKSYYGWVDARSPLSGTRTMADCNLDVLNPAPTIPASAIMSDDQNLSTTFLKNTITDFNASPFTKKYIPNDAVCWRNEIKGTGTTEYNALQDVKTKARKAYLDTTGLVSGYVPSTLPLAYASVTAFDKTTNTYYAWWDARGPVHIKNTDTQADYESECVLLEELHKSNESMKVNPLQLLYVTDNKYYRAVGSGSDSTYVGARSIAIQNALIDIAQQEGIADISTMIYDVLPEEKYYAKDPVTGNYDYWLAVESKK